MSSGREPMSPSLHRTIVCYADILGFRSMTKSAFESGEETEFLGRIKRSIDMAYQRLGTAAALDGETAPANFDMKVFTDNIVVAYPLLAPARDRGEPELIDLLMLFAEVQASLAAEGLFLRGAIAEGRHYQDRNIVFGDAFLVLQRRFKEGCPGMSGDVRRAARRLAWERLARSLRSCVSSSHRSSSFGPNRSRGSISRTTWMADQSAF